MAMLEEGKGILDVEGSNHDARLDDLLDRQYTSTHDGMLWVVFVCLYAELYWCSRPVSWVSVLFGFKGNKKYRLFQQVMGPYHTCQPS
jgi:hypothetical protein